LNPASCLDHIGRAYSSPTQRRQERNRTLGRRGLYRSTGGDAIESEINARLWVLNLSDGEHSLLDIAERSGQPFSAINQAAQTLREGHLLEVISEEVTTRLEQSEGVTYSGRQRSGKPF